MSYQPDRWVLFGSLFNSDADCLTIEMIDFVRLCVDYATRDDRHAFSWFLVSAILSPPWTRFTTFVVRHLDVGKRS